MNDTLNAVKNLREITGAGFLDCKKALLENNNNIESSIDYLRKNGLLKATKKSSREAKDGAIGIYSNNKKTVILKINSETDFAAKSETFLNFIDKMGKIAISDDSNFEKNSFLNFSYEGKNIKDYFIEIISIIGENIILNDIKTIFHNENYFNFYVHNSYKSNIGKIISLATYNTSNNDNIIKQFTKNLCMHIAAAKPEALDVKFLDSDFIKKEEEFQKDNIKSSGKPDNIIQKILEGKMKKFYSESTLLNQNFVIDPDKTVNEAINALPEKYSFELLDYKFVALS